MIHLRIIKNKAPIARIAQGHLLKNSIVITVDVGRVVAVAKEAEFGLAQLHNVLVGDDFTGGGRHHWGHADGRGHGGGGSHDGGNNGRGKVHWKGTDEKEKNRSDRSFQARLFRFSPISDAARGQGCSEEELLWYSYCTYDGLMQ